MNWLANNGYIILAALGGIMVVVATLWSSVQQNYLQGKLQIKTEEVADLTKKNLNVIQGGDSFPVLSPEFDDENNGIIFSVFNEGQYSLFDLDLYITEEGNINSELFPTKKHFSEIGSGKNIPSIFKTVLPEEINEKKINVVTSARNGETRQVYTIFRSSGNIGVKTEIYRDGELIFKE